LKQPVLNFSKPQPPIVVERLMPYLTWRLPRKEKTVYLTFDDGPVPKYTEWVMNTLESYDVKGTFFCVGENVVNYPEIFQQLQAKGHQVGSHTYNHLNGWLTANSKYYENAHKAAELVPTDLYRPPYGKIKLSQSKKLTKDFNIIMWDVITKDYDPSLGGKACFKNVVDYVDNGSIIVFHDSEKAFKNYEYALPKTIDYLLENNYKIKPINLAPKKA